MFRYFATILLLTAFAAQTFQQGIIVLDYYTNTSSFAKNCENKAIPMMHCNGKCQMMKKLKEEEKKQQQHPERKMENKFEVLSSRSFYPSVPVNYAESTRKFNELVPDVITARPGEILKPPIA